MLQKRPLLQRVRSVWLCGPLGNQCIWCLLTCMALVFFFAKTLPQGLRVRWRAASGLRRLDSVFVTHSEHAVRVLFWNNFLQRWQQTQQRLNVGQKKKNVANMRTKRICSAS